MPAALRMVRLDHVLVLTTSRLRLRWFTAADADPIVALLNDPDWLRYIGDRQVRTRADALAFVADRLVASCWHQGFGMWAIERRDTGAVAGMCGLVRRDLLPDLDLGYALLPAHRGHGFVREAALACRDYAAAVLGERRLLAITDPDNARSIAVLTAIGMRRHGEVTMPDRTEPSALFEWLAPGASGDDRAAIDALVARFFAAFTIDGDRVPTVASLPHLFASKATVSIAGAGGVAVQDVRAFVEPRAELLFSGRLRAFAEREIEHRTEVSGAIAHRLLRYEKRGVLDGTPFVGGGTKSLQLVKTTRGWRIAALAWQDDGAGGAPAG